MKHIKFTLVECMIIVFTLSALAAILCPVVLGQGSMDDARRSAAQSTCTSRIRQLATAAQMYVQDNYSRYPGVKWNAAIENYVGKRITYFCPMDESTVTDPISYGYAGILVRTDSTGCNEAQIKAPTEVGCIADATPTRAWKDGGGLIGGGALMDSADGKTLQLAPRHNGVIIGFCDGHAKFFPGRTINLKDISSGPGRAFFQMTGLCYCNNPGGGIPNVSCNKPSNATITIGGDYPAYPLVLAAADVWATKGGTWYSRGFRGSGDYFNGTGAKFQDFHRAVASGQYAWATADDSPTVGIPIAKDAMVIIVSQNCKIPAISTGGVATTTGLVHLFSTGYVENKLQVYTYNQNNGTRAYLTGKLKEWGATTNKEFGVTAQVVADDSDMVDKVAADPYGIGYCSAGFADNEKVTILGLHVNDITYYYPNNDPAKRWVVPDDAADSNYPLIRTIRVLTGGEGKKLALLMHDKGFLAGPLFKTSYIKP